MLRLPSVRYAGDGSREVRRVAVLPGSGAEAIARGVAQVADVLVTGDVKYHEARVAQAQGLALIDAPHGVTEQEGVLRWAERLARRARPGGDGRDLPRPGRGRLARRGRRRRAAMVDAPAAAEAAQRGAGRRSGCAAGVAEAVRPVNRDDDRYHLYTDGGARGNPGPAGIGARLMTAAGDVVEDLADYIGKATNNVAEYQALIAGLEIALDRGVERLDVFLDSELVVRQVNGQYKVKDAGLKPLHQQACLLLSKFHEVDVQARAPRAERGRGRPREPGDRRGDDLAAAPPARSARVGTRPQWGIHGPCTVKRTAAHESPHRTSPSFWRSSWRSPPWPWLSPHVAAPPPMRRRRHRHLVRLRAVRLHRRQPLRARHDAREQGLRPHQHPRSLRGRDRADGPRSCPYDQAAELVDQLPADKAAKIVVYCRSDRMSRIAADVWAAAGYTNLYNLAGGFVAWEQAGYPLLQSAPEVGPRALSSPERIAPRRGLW